MQRATVLCPLFPGPPVRKAEQNVIEALAADQPSDASEVALARQVERLARVLRRSPAAVNAQLARAKREQRAKQVDRALYRRCRPGDSTNIWVGCARANTRSAGPLALAVTLLRTH